jgi:periplasmic divalent cation tolerance protein
MFKGERAKRVMTDVLVVFCTCSDGDEASRIATVLIESHLAACVNILPEIKSVYRWQGSIETARETLLVIKTTQKRFEVLRDLIVSIHSYDTPEVLAVPVAEGWERYLSWVREGVEGSASG